MGAAPPYFPFFPAIFKEGTDDFTNEEVGAYVRLLCFQWANNGVPDEPRERALIMRCTLRSSQRLWSKIRGKFFYSSVENRWRNPRMEEERAKQFRRATLAEQKGRAGAAARWRAHDAPANAHALREQCPDDGPLDLVRTSTVSSTPDLRSTRGVRVLGREIHGHHAQTIARASDDGPPGDGFENENAPEPGAGSGSDLVAPAMRDRAGATPGIAGLRSLETPDPGSGDRAAVPDAAPDDDQQAPRSDGARGGSPEAREAPSDEARARLRAIGERLEGDAAAARVTPRRRTHERSEPSR